MKTLDLANDKSSKALLQQSETAKNNKGIYVYCIMETRPVLNNLDDDFSLFLINYQKLYVLASEVSTSEFKGHISEDNIDMKWLQEKTKKHEKIVENVLKRTELLPVSFGTVLNSVPDCKKFIRKNYDLLLKSLEKLKYKREWNLKVTVIEKTLINKIEIKDEKIKNLKDKIETSSTGTAYMLKKRLESLIEEQKEKHLKQVAEKIESNIIKVVIAEKINERKGPEQKVDEEIIIDKNYLVHQDKKEIFIKNLEKIDKDIQKYGIKMKLIGPWPVYSFVPKIEFGG